MVGFSALGSLSGDTQEDMKRVYNHVYQLEEYLRYALDNLDVTNFNDLGLARYENGRMQVYAQALEVKASALKAEFRDADGELKTEISATISGIQSTVTEQGNSISSLSQTASQLQSTVTAQGNTISGMQSTITQNANSISAIVQSVGSNGSVTAASIVAAINAAGSTVQISADHITLTGYVTFSSLETEGEAAINGANITAGEINAVNFVASGSLDGSVSNSFVVKDDANGNIIGHIGYQWVSSDGQRGDKLWIRTVQYSNYYPAVKISAAGDVSIQSEREDGLVYVASNGTISLQGPDVFIYDGTSAWHFKDGNLYKNGTAVL